MDMEYISLEGVWKVILRRKYVLGLSATATTLSTFVYVSLQPPVYSTAAVIRVAPPAIFSKMPGNDIISSDPEQLTGRMMSAEVGEEVALRLGWIRAGSSPGEVANAAKKVLSMYSASVDGNTVTITATGTERKVLDKVANLVVDVFKEFDKKQKIAEAVKSLDDLAKRKTDIEASLADLEEQRQAFLNSHRAAGPHDALGQQLAELESKKKELLQTYTEHHPSVIAIDGKIADLQKQMTSHPAAMDDELSRISGDLRTTEDIYSSVSRQYEEAKLAISNMSSFVTVISSALPPERAISPSKSSRLRISLLLGLVLGLASAFVIENLDVSISTVEDLEQFLKLPVLGILPGVTPKGARLANFGGIRREDSPEAFLDKLIINHAGRSPTIEAYHTLRSNILSRPESPPHMALALTSAGALEGKTLTACNMALAAAHSGLRTLLVDVDMRKHAIHAQFGLKRDPGLSDILLQRVQWRDTLRGTVDFVTGALGMKRVMGFTGLDNLQIITSGKPLPNVIALLDSPLWAKLIAEWKENFDFVLLDTPPVLLFVDAIIASKAADGTLLVYRSGMISRLALKRASNQLLTGGARIIGIALNDARTSVLSPHYGYYSDYGRYLDQMGPEPKNPK